LTIQKCLADVGIATFPAETTAHLLRPVLSLIVPTYNERENIFELVNKVEYLLKYLNFEIIIVDDNSPDGTGKIAKFLNHKHGNVKIFTRLEKLGLSSAVLHGFDKADSDVVAVIDADMQHPPTVLVEMYNKISEGYDLVVASRYINGGRLENWAFLRKLFSRGANALAHLLLPNSRRIKDVMSGYFMIKKSIIKNKNFNPIGFKILLEILGKCRIKRVIEIPYTFTNRRNGKSNMTLKEVSNFLFHLYTLFFHSILSSANGRAD
jgi:dolichol-phosphate mannosyltransferase